jgi:hypothetical protein
MKYKSRNYCEKKPRLFKCGRRRDTHPQKGLSHLKIPPLLERQWLQEAVLQMHPLQSEAQNSRTCMSPDGKET